MAQKSLYRAHKVLRRDRDDGAILLRSGYDMSVVADKTTDWLAHFARETPDAVFLGERSGDGWREETYGAVQQIVSALATSLIARGLGPDKPILIISGNSVNHGLLMLAAQMVGVPTVPVAEQYALIPAAHPQLVHIANVTRPAMVYAEDGARVATALALPALAGVEKVSATKAEGMTSFSELLKGDTGVDLEATVGQIGPESVVKILMTSGSTSSPKGVATTHRMMCANQAQVADALPFLKTRPPRLMDWLPWNHVFGGSHNFNMALANGGSLHIDAGKPVKALMGTTIENILSKPATIAFNVPIGFAFLRDAMREDAGLRKAYFHDLDMLFYAGASLPQDIWNDLWQMALDVRGDVPLFNSSWGLTETAPAVLIQHEPTEMSGVIGAPMTGTTIKLIPDDDMRCEVRVKGPNIFKGYLNDAEKTAEAFDDEGFFITGDAMKLVDPNDPNMGLKFDGRISEDFKLMSGTWVRAGNLRLDVLQELAPLVSDIVICGADRQEIGLFIFPSPELLALSTEDVDGLLTCPNVAEQIRDRLQGHKTAGSSGRINRVVVLSEQPSLADGEITAKGNLNFRKIQTRRAALLDRLYNDADPATIIV